MCNRNVFGKTQQNVNMVLHTAHFDNLATRNIYQLTNIRMYAFPILLFDFGTRGLDVKNQMDIYPGQ